LDRHPLEGWKDEIEVMRQTGVARIRPEVRDQDRQIHVLQRAGAGHVNFSWNLIPHPEDEVVKKSPSVHS